MNYTNELDFFTELMKRYGVKVRMLTAEQIEELYSAELLGADREALGGFLSGLAPDTLYRTKDALGCSYKLLLMNRGERETRVLLIIGPYRQEPPSDEQLLEISERLGLTPARHHELKLYLSSVPTLAEDSPLMGAIAVLCERVFGTRDYEVVFTQEEAIRPDVPLTKTLSDVSVDDAMVSMREMEERDAFENKIIRSVELGLTGESAKLASAFNSKLFDVRTSDPIRNAKNYCIIMNTLLRKAAERGGVHPIYLDRMSSSFAVKIEECELSRDCTALMSQMYRDYTRLVKKHSFRSYSPVVRRVILAVESDLSRELSTATLSDSQGISAGYLSAVFKRETGVTLTEFIRMRRMEYAQYLLDSTSLQIQTVALHCGILDLQYFSKLFKRHTGMTPSEYRQRGAK
ncbi:MAG: helix-turn-helix domain-containing protein [Clostridia bacterium]|nr:helix-turn-helix domain-containing protein [Clostridia bacterium]